MTVDRHQPVLLSEVLNAVCIDPSGVYVDATLGMGGHTLGIIHRCAGLCKVIGIDQDAQSLQEAQERLSEVSKNVAFVNQNFSSVESFLREQGVYGHITGIVMDLGISSVHLDEASRGFSFRLEGPLDMRMDQKQSLTAEQIVNEWSEEKLCAIFQDFGEERYSRRIARAIALQRMKQKIRNTQQLSQLILDEVPGSYSRQKIHPATRVFQALRIATNDELQHLNTALSMMVEGLKPSGRIAVISFHSLEDRIVKQTFRRLASEQKIRLVTRKPVVPGVEEIEHNPRSRSAKLRIAERV